MQSKKIAVDKHVFMFLPISFWRKIGKYCLKMNGLPVFGSGKPDRYRGVAVAIRTGNALETT